MNVITSRGLYDDPSASLPQHETHRGVEIHRVGRTRFGRESLGGRAIDYLTMYWSFARALARLAHQRGDVAVVKTDPPLLSCAIAPVARARWLEQINWLQDLYPEVAVELGVRALKPVAPLVVALRDWSLKSSAHNVAIGELMARRLEARDIGNVSVIANWCDDEIITPVARDGNSLRAEWGLRGKFVIGYSGNLGRAHEYETLLSAAERLRDDSEIVLLFIGGGHQTQALKSEAERRRLARMLMFRSYQPAHVLAKSLSAPDIHWVSLRPEMEGLIVPSKFVAVAAAGRATLAVSDPNGEVGALVARYDCGLAIKPGDGEALANAIRALKADPDRLARMGRNAR
ncbi:MAG: glycosyltransferase family 4 protein, partial [Roseiarcus sp.]